jgi:hypothetical protein
MKKYFSKTLLALIIPTLVYFPAKVIKDQSALAALITITVLLCMIAYSYYNSNFNQFGNE